MCIIIKTTYNYIVETCSFKCLYFNQFCLMNNTGIRRGLKVCNRIELKVFGFDVLVVVTLKNAVF
jgi:hypothetical protein